MLFISIFSKLPIALEGLFLNNKSRLIFRSARLPQSHISKFITKSTLIRHRKSVHNASMFSRLRNKTMTMVSFTTKRIYECEFTPREYSTRASARSAGSVRGVSPLFKPRGALLFWCAQCFHNCFPKWNLEKVQSYQSLS